MRYTTAGESNGTSLVAVVTDVPAGLRLHEDAINADIARWAQCYGKRELPVDGIHILTGVHAGRTTGAPVTLFLDNSAYLSAPANAHLNRAGGCASPRPGTAELAGALNTDADDCSVIAGRDALRADVMRIAAAAVAREFLADFGVDVQSYVTRIGHADMREEARAYESLIYPPLDIETSSVRCPSAQATRSMEAALAAAVKDGDTLGGEFALIATNVVPGLGGYADPQENMAMQLSSAVFRARGVTGVQLGCADRASRMRGFDATDALAFLPGEGFSRETNMAGGVEAGMTTGKPVVMRALVAPSAAFGIPVPTIDMATLEPVLVQPRAYEPCLVPSAAVAAEAEVSFVLANAYLRKFGEGAMADIHASFAAYERRLKLAAR